MTDKKRIRLDSKEFDELSFEKRMNEYFKLMRSMLQNNLDEIQRLKEKEAEEERKGASIN